MNAARHLLFLLTCCFTACTHGASVDHLVDVRAKIAGYEPIQERLWLNDGTTFTFDRVTLQIETPEKWKGKLLRADHEVHFLPDVNWNTVGVEVTFRIDAELLQACLDGQRKLHTSDFDEIKVVAVPKSPSTKQAP